MLQSDDRMEEEENLSDREMRRKREKGRGGVEIRRRQRHTERRTDREIEKESFNKSYFKFQT